MVLRLADVTVVVLQMCGHLNDCLLLSDPMFTPYSSGYSARDTLFSSAGTSCDRSDMLQGNMERPIWPI